MVGNVLRIVCVDQFGPAGQQRDKSMRTASITLHGRVHRAIALPLACPCAVKLRRCMRATAACRDRCCGAVACRSGHILYLYQSGLVLTPGGGSGAKMICSAFRLAAGLVRISVDYVAIQLVVVFVDRQIHGSRHAGQRHVNLHLCVMRWLGFATPFFCRSAKLLALWV